MSSKDRHLHTSSLKLQIEYIAISRLRPSPRNPRIMPPGELQRLIRSLQTYGFVVPALIRASDNMIVGGHQRVEAAKALGWKEVPAIRVQLGDAQAAALNVALNKISADWDLPQLAQILEGLRELPDFDVTLTGFDPKELEALVAEVERDQQLPPQEETFAQALEAIQAQRESAPTRVKAGQVWRLGRHRLLCGDSLAPGALEGLLAGKKADLVLTDPPYGIGFQSHMARRGRRKRPIANDGVDEFEGFLARAVPAIHANMARGATLLWCAGAGGPQPVLAKAMLAIAAHFRLQNLLVWDKCAPGLGWRFRSSWEAIIEASLGTPRVWNDGSEARNVLRFVKAVPGPDEHATPKPIPLLAELIRATAPTRGLVLDPFLGGGSTLVAAELCGRTCCAAEIDPRYCDLTLSRWEACSGCKATLDTGGTRNHAAERR
jgi:ParB-like chromosome segregation protein Spo0J